MLPIMWVPEFIQSVLTLRLQKGHAFFPVISILMCPLLTAFLLACHTYLAWEDPVSPLLIHLHALCYVSRYFKHP